MKMEKVGNVIIDTLVSNKNYQRQICIVPPWTVIPEHSHKNVRTQITFLHGFAIFEKGGRSIPLYTHSDSGRSFIIEPDEAHSARTQEQFCIFLTEQYWLNDEPVRSLHLNWIGEPINKDHEKQLTSRRH